MTWSIQRIARLAGTTSRALRHYEQLGLLAPAGRAANGYRYYDEAALTRLQRILLLRELGLGLPAIADVLAGDDDDARALATHLQWLCRERDRIDRQIASVTTTIAKLEREEPLMPDESLDGFDHTRYREEVEQRWGAEAYARSDRWWRELGDDGRAAFQTEAPPSSRASRMPAHPRWPPTPTRCRPSPPGTGRGCARAGAARLRALTPTSGSATCTSPTPASRSTTAGSRAPSSCAPRCASTQRSPWPTEQAGSRCG